VQIRIDYLEDKMRREAPRVSGKFILDMSKELRASEIPGESRLMFTEFRAMPPKGVDLMNAQPYAVVEIDPTAIVYVAHWAWIEMENTWYSCVPGGKSGVLPTDRVFDCCDTFFTRDTEQSVLESAVRSGYESLKQLLSQREVAA
jgi:hypothetical protein